MHYDPLCDFVLCIRWRRTWNAWDIQLNFSCHLNRSSQSHEWSQAMKTHHSLTKPGARTTSLLYFDNGIFLPGIHIIMPFVYNLDSNANYIEKYRHWNKKYLAITVCTLFSEGNLKGVIVVAAGGRNIRWRRVYNFGASLTDTSQECMFLPQKVLQNNRWGGRR